MIFPDYSLQVQKNRCSYDKVKQNLRTLEIRYMLVYPAKLKVIYQGKAIFFTTPEEAKDWAMETPNLKPNPVPEWGSSRDHSGGRHRAGRDMVAGRRRS